ncbi:hypothetical protein [Caballeronia sp. dw_276]|uniref:hypothetical protein n=1 Tax=Caballeronia sp. dw_276 TaxID=2719795 RepID=UPI001BD2D9EC|nr:hypothetical protein [Caballeronia sp. dw_276]
MPTLTNVLPFDERAGVYRRRQNTDANPYVAGTWQHGEWFDGWKNANECDPDDGYDWLESRFKVE